MTPHDAFLAAILAAPDDDAPRLIFADWLEERGDALVRAAPIQDVTLTTWPTATEMYRLARKNGFGVSPGTRVRRWRDIFAAEWPSVRTWRHQSDPVDAPTLDPDVCWMLNDPD